MIDWIQNIDTKLFLQINGHNNPFWDKIMWFASGKISWLPLYAILLFLIIKKFRISSWLPMLAIVVLITLSDQVSVHLFKNVFERLRPCHNPEIRNLVHLVNNKCGGQYGFVSSHAANTFSLAIFIGLAFKSRLLSCFLYSWAAFVSFSRIYLGNHYPGDVLGGALLGLGIAYLTYFLFRWTNLKIYGRSTHRDDLLKTP